MTEDRPDDELDPVEVVPTDNSTGVPVDLDRVAEVEDDAGADAE